MKTKLLTHGSRLLAIAALACACGTKDKVADAQKSLPKNPTTSPNLNDKDSVAKYLTPIDPASAAVSLAAGPFLDPASENSTLQVPTFTLSGINSLKADYVQIARCVTGASLRAPTGEKLEEIAEGTTNRQQLLKWIWVNSIWDNSVECKILGGPSGKNTRERFQDLSAQSGSFFYIINPCLRNERSSKKEVCSYNLVVTSSISFKNTLTEEFRLIAEELAAAEGRLAAIYSQLYYSAQAIRFQKDACETNYAANEAGKNFWKGFVSLSIAGVGAAVGGAMSGGTAALMGFKTGLAISVGFFGKLPAEPNICPMADKHIQDAQASMARMPAALDEVLKLRIKLSEIESTYGKLDQSILDADRSRIQH